VDSKGSELYELNRLGALPTKNSGRGRFDKADGIIYLGSEPMLSVDVKEYAESYGVSVKSWAKITTDAKQNRSEPMLHLALGDSEPKTRVVCISEQMFLEFMECYREKYE
jgi:hypothetical protein